MKVIELPYQTPGGQQTARVFMDDDGLVSHAHGLQEILDELLRRKKAVVRTVDASAVSDFLNHTRPCPAGLEALRESYTKELLAADRSGCSKCDKSGIARRYVKLASAALAKCG